MNLNLKLIAAAFICTAGLHAQNTTPKRTCATGVPSAEWDSWFNQKVEEYKRDLSLNKTQVVPYTIPVVFHIVHGGQAAGTFPNLSQAQINSQIPILNNDFAGTGQGVAQLAATAFSAVGAANTNISFCLAELDPNGNALVEPGIDRINYNSMGWTNPATINNFNTFKGYIDGTIKPNSIWDPTQYLNIWVTDHHNAIDILGYATFPAGTGMQGLPGGNTGTINDDGVYLWSRCVGNVGVLFNPYNLGRTASHEIGHWLGLRHIGGDASLVAGDCAATDYCNDTPPQKGGYMGGAYGQNYGAPSYPLYPTGSNSCPSSPNGCMFMNFMDYCDDASLYMFTPDQSARMNVAMTNGFFRSQLTASSATLCNIPSVMPVADFMANGAGCTDSIISINNQTTGTPMPSYVWSVIPAIAGVGILPNNTSASPTFTFSTPWNYTITLTATNAAGTSSATLEVPVVYCGSSVGMEAASLLDRRISLSPNPSNGLVNIATALSGNQDLEVSVHNYLGQFVTAASYKNVNAGSYQLDLGSYTNGVYFITISNGQEKTVKRLILNK